MRTQLTLHSESSVTVSSASRCRFELRRERDVSIRLSKFVGCALGDRPPATEQLTSVGSEPGYDQRDVASGQTRST